MAYFISIIWDTFIVVEMKDGTHWKVEGTLGAILERMKDRTLDFLTFI